MASLFNTVLKARVENLKKNIPQTVFARANKNIEQEKLALTFTVLCVMEILDYPIEDALETLVDGSQDQCIDAIDIDMIDDSNVQISIFQTKFFDISTPKILNKHIGENDTKGVIDSVQKIIKGKEIINANDQLIEKLKEIREIAQDGVSFNFNIYCITNGEAPVPESIKKYGQIFENDHTSCNCFFYNTDDIIHQNNKPPKVKDHSIKTIGQIIEYNLQNLKGIICNVALAELINLYENAGKDSLLEQNIRGYLGSGRTSINKKIQDTAVSEPEAIYFGCYNNGISVICDKADCTDDTLKNYNILLRNPQIINGGQTTKSLYNKFLENPEDFREKSKNAFIMLRIYETINPDLSSKITQNTNSQNAINFRDLQANSRIQQLVQSYFNSHGYYLDIKRGYTDKNNQKSIKNENLVQIFTALYDEQPHLSKRSKTRVFRANFYRVFSEGQHSIAEKLLRGYKLWEYISQQEQRDHNYSLLSHGKYAILYTMSLLDSKLLELTVPLSEELLFQCYTEAIEIVKQVYEDAKTHMGTAHSYANLFKAAISTELINRYFGSKTSITCPQPQNKL